MRCCSKHFAPIRHLALALGTALVAFAQGGTISSVSVANYRPIVAPNSIVSGWGTALAATTAVANDQPAIATAATPTAAPATSTAEAAAAGCSRFHAPGIASHTAGAPTQSADNASQVEGSICKLAGIAATSAANGAMMPESRHQARAEVAAFLLREGSLTAAAEIDNSGRDVGARAGTTDDGAPGTSSEADAAGREPSKRAAYEAAFTERARSTATDNVGMVAAFLG